MEQAEKRLTYTERLDLARRHGTRGEFMLECPRCGWHWRAKVRWHRERQKWMLLTRESAFCPDCFQRYLHIAVGRRILRMGHYEGSWSEEAL